MNMNEFKKAYINNYEYLYNHKGMVAGYHEAAAFVFTLRKLKIK